MRSGSNLPGFGHFIPCRGRCEGLTLVTDTEREHLLNRVLAAADLYLHSGQGTHEHAMLVRAVDKAKEGVRPGLQINRL